MKTAIALLRLAGWYAAVLITIACLCLAYCYVIAPAVLRHLPTDPPSLGLYAAITLAVSTLLALLDLHEERADLRKRGYL